MKRTLAAPLVAGIVAVVVAACSSGSTATQSPPPSPSAPAPATSSASGGHVVTIDLEDYRFVPSTFSAPNNATIVLVNKGKTLHNFTITGSPVSVDVQPGQTVTLTPPPSPFAPGTYKFFCKYHQALGMTGTLQVTTGS